MTQRNSYTPWPGLRRLNRLPSETVLDIGWSRYQTTGSHQVPASCLLNRCHTVRGGLTQPLLYRDESSTRRNTGKTTLNEVAVTSHNVNWPVGPAET